MTVSVRISVNGNYKLPYSYKQGAREEAGVISGYGLNQPNEKHITFYHGPDSMSLNIGPEEKDDGPVVEKANGEAT